MAPWSLTIASMQRAWIAGHSEIGVRYPPGITELTRQDRWTSSFTHWSPGTARSISGRRAANHANRLFARRRSSRTPSKRTSARHESCDTQ